MIIWKGYGILVGLVAIAGIILGVLIGGAIGLTAFSGALGLAIAALVNRAIWKKIYPKEPRILTDDQGRQFIDKPGHSLFFIPAPAWTWIFAALVIPATFIGIIGSRQDAKDAATPGHAAFQAANQLITSKSNGTAHGNTITATASAGTFADLMKTMTDASFSGGSKRTTLTGGNFLTYCQDTEDEVIFICHVPELRNYKDKEAKDALAEIAWSCATISASELDPSSTKSLTVGLRGIATYGIILHAGVMNSAPIRKDKAHESDVFYPAFAAANPAEPAQN